MDLVSCAEDISTAGGTVAAMRWLSDKPRAAYLLLFLAAFAVLALVSGKRLGQQSSDPHFVMQADAWLHGTLEIVPPWKGDDPARVETVLLKNGDEVRGRYLHTRHWLPSEAGARPTSATRAPKSGQGRLVRVFRTTAGSDIPATAVAKTLSSALYVSFPPAPTLLMLPSTLVSGRRANDVLPTLLIAALIFPLCFATLRRLSSTGISGRSDSDNLWFSVQLSFGTVLFFVSVAGKVWFTAHVVGVALALAYLYFSIGAKRPFWAGLCLGLAALTRTPMAFMFPFFALETLRSVCGNHWYRGWRNDFQFQLRSHGLVIAKHWLWFAVPILVLAALAAAQNTLRFDSASEFGHSYLAVRQQGMIEQFGLFDYEYLRRNLSVAFALLPGLSSKAPFVHISLHGMALWVTTPLFLSLLWPRFREDEESSSRRLVHRTLWLTVACVGVPILFYQNSGWAQFGYRFSLDYTSILILLLAISGRRLGRISKTLILISLLVNAFGALTFGQHREFYDGGTYDVVVPHHPYTSKR